MDIKYRPTMSAGNLVKERTLRIGKLSAELRKWVVG